MKQETVIQVWNDKHELRRDRRQWIVRHPCTCPNGRRGNLQQDYAKATYFSQKENMLYELRLCGLSSPVQVPQEPKVLVVVLNPMQKMTEPDDTDETASKAAMNAPTLKDRGRLL